MIKINHHKFPKRIFSSFFAPYFSFQPDTAELANVHAEIWQLCSLSDAKKNKSQPFLRWVTICDKEFQKIFPKVPNTAQNCQKLWKYSVSEIFFAHPKYPHYLECEVTPYGHHLILKFEDIRKQIDVAFQHNIKLLNELDETNHTIKFGMEFPLDDLIEYIDKNSLKIQCALSLGDEQYFLAPGWKLDDTTQKADFHQPKKFCTMDLTSL